MKVGNNDKINALTIEDLLPFLQGTPPALADPAVYYGLAGEVVRTISPFSEADDVALLISFLTGFGNLVGRNAHFIAGADRHYTNLFAVLVGDTAKGRKGMSWNWAYSILSNVDESWTRRCITGLSSGEGLIFAAGGGENKKKKKEENEEKTPIDKRLMIEEAEFSGVLKVMGRHGNTLSPVLRNAWDGKPLQVATKNLPIRVENAHISIIAHITREELTKIFNNIEKASGFANRFLWVFTRRSKYLPAGEPLPQAEKNRLVQQIYNVAQFARGVGRVQRDEDAERMWEKKYPDLSEGQPGLIGAVLGRAEPQVMRLAMIYALLDMSNIITTEHLHAALALWEYAKNSARYIFTDTKNTIEAKILNALEQGPLTQTQIYQLFRGNVRAERYETALANLRREGLITNDEKTAPGAKKPTIIWKLINT